MTDNDIYSTSKEEAARMISENIGAMKRLYNDVIRLADYHGIRVVESLEFPSDISVGQNYPHSAEIYWNPSSAHC